MQLKLIFRKITEISLEDYNTVLNKSRDGYNITLNKLSLILKWTKRLFGRGIARLWSSTYKLKYLFSLWVLRHGTVAKSIVLLLFLGIGFYFHPTLQSALEPYFTTDLMFERLQSLLLTLGGALIGATAIAFSLMVFAMQVNVERMPYGLFRKISADWQFLSAFAGAFLLAILVATLSLIPEKSWLAVAALGAGGGTFLILILFLYSYRRALSLISPMQQLRFLIEDAQKDMKVWVRRAQRAAPLIEGSEATETDQEAPLRSAHDLKRTTFFQLNPQWTMRTQQAILHAISFARRYAEQGDYEISNAALNAVVAINAAYIEAKGNTFFAHHWIADNPFAMDGFVNDTLERLRQNVRIGLSRGDEQHIVQTLQAMAALVAVYLGIDYSDKHASKTHANLAAGYLADAVQSIAPHNLADVLMEGVRLMGESAQRFIGRGQTDDIIPLIEKIALISCVGIAKENYRPITLTGMKQLANLTFNLIRSEAHDTSYVAGKIKENVSLVANLFLSVPDAPMQNIHSTYLHPYYSATGTQTLSTQLAYLVNAVVKAKADDEAAQTIIQHVEEWARDLYRTEKELFLAAIEKESPLTFHMIYWIAHMTKLLLATSNAPACKNHTQDELQKHALWLISVLSFIPDDKDKVAFVENSRMTETLFDAALDAHSRNCDEVSKRIFEILLSWAFKAGRHDTGWAILERSIYGLATLALIRGDALAGSCLMAAISKRLAEEKAPDQETRYRTAREIRQRAATLYRQGGSSRIENAMSQVDHEKLSPLLEGIANLLSPETANEPVNLRIF